MRLNVLLFSYCYFKTGEKKVIDNNVFGDTTVGSLSPQTTSPA